MQTTAYNDIPYYKDALQIDLVHVSSTNITNSLGKRVSSVQQGIELQLYTALQMKKRKEKENTKSSL